MTENIVSKRYAQALFSLGQKQGEKQLLIFGQDLKRLTEIIYNSDKLIYFFHNPIFMAEEKKSVLLEIFKENTISQAVKNFCFLLADKNRLSCLIVIQNHFSELLDIFQGIISGTLTSAIPLSKELEDKIQNTLKDKTKKEVRLAFSVDKGLIGGFKLKIGDKVIDASIKTQLEILKENIKRGE